jgi:hypothetical protein
MDDIDHGEKDILSLVKQAYKGDVMLPDFQRNFVWDRKNIEEFIESLLANIFVGTFLVLKTSKEEAPFKCIFVQGAKEVNPDIKSNPSIIVIDGQQRLTSLFYAIYSPNIPLRNTERPYAFFIDLKKLAEDKEDNADDAVFSISKDERNFRKLLSGKDYDIEKLKEQKIMPLSMFRDGIDFGKLWYTDFINLFDVDKAQKVKEYLDNIFKYQVITLTLPYSFNEKPEEIVILFERLNRTGIKLSTYDLLVARMYKFINLREEWEKLFGEGTNYINIKKLARNRVDNTDIPFNIIQALALSKGKSIKDKDLIKIDSEILNKSEWDRAVNVANDKVLNLLFDRGKFGIDEDIDKWMPYSTTVIPMLALFLKYEHPDISKLEKWYWSVVFSERYSGSIESDIMKDFREMSKWIEDNNFLPEAVRDFREQLQKEVFTLKEVKNVGSSLYKGVFNLIFKNDPCDFYELENIANNSLNDHHVFPKNFLKSKEVDVEPDLVLNRTLIFDSTNKMISNKSPSEYIKEIIHRYVNRKYSVEKARAKLIDVMNKHFINEEMVNIMENTSKDLPAEKIKENYENFIKLREKLIIKRIEEIVGLEED